MNTVKWKCCTPYQVTKIKWVIWLESRFAREIEQFKMDEFFFRIFPSAEFTIAGMKLCNKKMWNSGSCWKAMVVWVITSSKLCLTHWRNNPRESLSAYGTEVDTYDTKLIGTEVDNFYVLQHLFIIFSHVCTFTWIALWYSFFPLE